MRKVASALLFLLLPVTASSAQDRPAPEVTGAYQFTRLYGLNVPLGWDASVNIPTNDWFGVVGDFGGATKSEFGIAATLLTFGAGPQFTLRIRKVEPYFRVVFGAAHGSTSLYGFSASAFLVAPGGGADFRISDHAWLRLGASYPLVRKYGATFDGIQALVGVTYTFGGRSKTTSAARNQTTNVPSSDVALLGVSGHATTAGFQVDSVRAGSPAVFLKPGDIVTKIDGREVHGSQDVQAAIAASTTGTIKVGFLLQTTAVGMVNSEREVKVR